jgi:predicted Zn-dependent protease
LFFALSWKVQAQVFTVGPSTSQQPATSNNQATPPGQSLGWGSNIENARLARAAELALQKGDHAEAADYAWRAAHASPGDPHLWFLLGYAARLADKPGLSSDAYARGLRIAPTSIEGLSGLAQTYSVLGRTEQAEDMLKKVLEAEPRRVDETVLLGDLYMRGGDYPTAIEWLTKGERMSPSARPEVLLALCYQRQNKMDLASHYLDLAKRHDPNNPDVQRTLAGYYREVGKYKEAIAALQSIKTPHPDVQAELAFTFQLNGQLKDAASLYAKVAEELPKDLEVQLSAAQAQVAIGSIEQANALLDRAAKLSPDYYRVHAIRAEIAQIEERPADAIREYTAALARLPEEPADGPLYGIQLHVDLMDLYASTKDPVAAHGQLEIAQSEIAKLDERGSDRAGFLRLRAMIKLSAGELSGAMSDIEEALALAPSEFSSLQLKGDLFMKMGKPEDAIASYKRIVAMDAVNRYALISLGYASRAAGRDGDAEKYFRKLASAYPDFYVAYLALGDLYTSRRDYAQAQTAYTRAYSLNSNNPMIIAGGLNATIEAHHLDQAAVWVSRATPDTELEPIYLREKERYLSFKGDFAQSAEVGRSAMDALPQDRDVAVYLGYDLLNLKQDDDLLKLTAKYDSILPSEPDIPLLAGYVHKRQGLAEQAEKDFSETLQRDPNVVTAYVNRGYVRNDLHHPDEAALDFEAALKREPDNGEAHLGLAYSDLDLKKLTAALRQAQLAEQQLGESEYTHLIRATAYGRESLYAKAATQYRAAIVFAPDHAALHYGLAGALFAERRYHPAIDELEIAQKLDPEDPFTYALLARSYASLNDREATLRYVALAEQHLSNPTGDPAKENPHRDPKAPPQASAIYLETGEALNTLGDQAQAMERYRRALDMRGADRVGVRLDIAQVMATQNHAEDATRQVALALLEAEAGDTQPPTGEQYIEAADVFRSLHEYDLSQNYLHRAENAGAPDTSVRLGLANNYLAIGETEMARVELFGAQASPDEPDYQLMLAKANVYRQEHQSVHALTSFAQASDAAGEDQTSDQSLLAAGADEGLRLTPKISVITDLEIDPIYEDTTMYVLDSKLDAPASGTTTLLPQPRSSLQTQWTGAYHLHLNNMPTFSGFLQTRNAVGQISVPDSRYSLVSRNTTDLTGNFGVDPTFHLGRNTLTLNLGIQGTVRRDTESPAAINQNLYRVFTYVATSSFFNLVSVSGYALREAGPFTEMNLSSRNLTAAVDFRVGAPWSKTDLVTGWGANDQLFSNKFENYYTSSYIGLEHQFSTRLHARAIVEDLRAWRVVSPTSTVPGCASPCTASGATSAIAQDLRPAGTVDFAPTHSWDLQASSAYSSTRSDSVYDAVQNGFSVSYARPFKRLFHDDSGNITLEYPIRFSGGVQVESFFNYTRGQSEQIRPYVSITLF